MSKINHIVLLFKALILRKTLEFLKCDRHGCLYVELHEDITYDMIDKPCPRCGDNLLTQGAYYQFKFKDNCKVAL